MSTVTEGSGSTSGSIRFLLDGHVKTINRPVTGAALHALAGSPKRLAAGDGKDIPNSHEPFDLKQDQELHSTPAKPGEEAPDADQQQTAAQKHEKREAILDEVAAGHGGPYADHPDHPGVETKQPAGTGSVGAHERPSEHPKVDVHGKKGRE